MTPLIRTTTKRARTLITASVDGHRVGRLLVMAWWGTPTVVRIDVKPTYRRKGVATRMYEAAAREACRKWGEPLRSDTDRSNEADAFWRKQAKKKRAVCMDWRADNSCRYYELRDCPAPESLAGHPTGRCQ